VVDLAEEERFGVVGSRGGRGVVRRVGGGGGGGELIGGVDRGVGHGPAIGPIEDA
jgi:hypothetical protein